MTVQFNTVKLRIHATAPPGKISPGKWPSTIVTRALGLRLKYTTILQLIRRSRSAVNQTVACRPVDGYR